MRSTTAIVRALALSRLTARAAALTSLAAFLSAAPFHAALAQTAPSLGAAERFSVLGGTAVTCTTSVVIGDVGVSPGTAFTNTGPCTIAGTIHLNDLAAMNAHAALLAAYTELAPQAGDCDEAHTLPSTVGAIPVANRTLFPGTYCTGAAFTGTDVTLTLNGNGDPNAVWIFKIGAGLTGTNFTVAMTNGAQACNVFWRVGAGVELTTSAFKGNILAGDLASDTTQDGSITLTGGSLAGRALANVAVTMTDASVIGCAALKAPKDRNECEADDEDKHHHKHHGRDHHKHDKDHDKHDKDHDKHDRDHGKNDMDHGKKYGS